MSLVHQMLDCNNALIPLLVEEILVVKIYSLDVYRVYRLYSLSVIGWRTNTWPMISCLYYVQVVLEACERNGQVEGKD